MNRAAPTLLMLLALGLSAPVPAQHSHHAQPAEPAAPAPMPSQRWPVDAALEDGMGRIHVALDELRHYEMGHMDATMALDRVGLIEQAAADIFARCKLPEDRDAVLHHMLVPLLAAAQALKAHPDDMAQVQAMRDAVAAYPRYFADPGWAAAAAH
ncbi:hypothetical protein [Dyella ginsengisoli]|uniref:hypothetical protein n=1 Tax=Dyella ginsengisoli TaxID=363848 RepID=UPI00034590CA|nr:hypothetical protein [Dyella ginsengisoli]